MSSYWKQREFSNVIPAILWKWSRINCWRMWNYRLQFWEKERWTRILQNGSGQNRNGKHKNRAAHLPFQNRLAVISPHPGRISAATGNRGGSGEPTCRFPVSFRPERKHQAARWQEAAGLQTVTCCCSAANIPSLTWALPRGKHWRCLFPDRWGAGGAANQLPHDETTGTIIITTQTLYLMIQRRRLKSRNAEI